MDQVLCDLFSLKKTKLSQGTLLLSKYLLRGFREDETNSSQRHTNRRQEAADTRWNIGNLSKVVFFP